MPVRNATLMKMIAPRARACTRKRRSTTRSKTPFRHPTRFQWSNQPHATIFGKQILALAPAQFMELLFEIDCVGWAHEEKDVYALRLDGPRLAGRVADSL